MKRRLVLLALLTAGITAITAANPETRNADTGGSDVGRPVRVVTLNVYHGVGAEFAAAASATSFADFLQKAAAVYHGYHARNFPERAAALAQLIDDARPDLIGVQEAVLVRTQSPADGPVTPATRVDLDYVKILLDALAARGLVYEVVVQSPGFDIEVPTALGFDLRHTDREVILARRDGEDWNQKLFNAQAANFVRNCQLPTATLGPITIRRSWVSIDVVNGGRTFRLISTHLDGDCLPISGPAIQLDQARELFANPAATDLPLVLIGDLNSPADGTGVTYNELAGRGFADAWTVAGSGPGLTCCQAADLLNTVPTFDRRIDLVLLRGGMRALSADTVGDEATARTASGMWPSDHASVVGVLRLEKR